MFWATVETWQCNMVTSVDMDLIPFYIYTAHSKVMKTQQLLLLGDYTLIKTYHISAKYALLDATRYYTPSNEFPKRHRHIMK